MRWIDARIFPIIKILLIIALLLAVGIFLIQVVPVKTIALKTPIPVDKHTVFPGDKIAANIVGEKYTSLPGVVTWTLVGVDAEGRKQRYVLLTTPATNPPGPIDTWVNLVIWPETRPGKYHIEQSVVYEVFGGLRKEAIFNMGDEIWVVKK